VGDDFFSGENLLNLWLGLFLASILIAGIWTGFFRQRKVQPNGFRWSVFRNEMLFAVVNLVFSGVVIGMSTQWLKTNGFITFNSEPAAWYVILAEYALYFFLFDTYFYWLHRWMHNGLPYKYVHKLHHLSTSPNLLTTLSVNPLESFINGGFVPLFLSVFVVHDATMALIGPTNIIMGLYVHSGYEFFPRWWNKTWATKWFITTTFHDQHHQFFRYNFGGYTTIWDRICGTMRPRFEQDFERLKARLDAEGTPPATSALRQSES